MKHWTPRPYQIKAVQHVLDNPGAGLFLEPGLGKTSVTLTALELFAQHDIKPALIVAPLRVCYSVWPKEAEKWGADLKVEILHGSGKDAALKRKADVYCINPEGLEWLVEQPHPDFEILVLDESTKFKNAKTVRYQNLEKLHAKAKRVICLTGTPAANSLQDIWAQIKLLDNGVRLGRFITPFRKKFFWPESIRIGGGRTIEIWHPTADTAQRIQACIQDICLYMKAEDWLAMPPIVTNTIDVQLPKAARKVYEELSDELFAEVRRNTISAANAAAKVQKLRQIAGGHVYGDDGTEHLHSAKEDALVELLAESQGQPVLVAVAFQHEAEALRRRLKSEFGLAVPYLGGGLSPKESDRIAADWNAGKLPVLLAHPSSVAHGLNLQAGGHTVVWYTLTWSREEYDQFNRRVYRQGQEHPVMIHHIMATDTVDQLVFDSLSRKDATQRSLLDLLKEAAK